MEQKKVWRDLAAIPPTASPLRLEAPVPLLAAQPLTASKKKKGDVMLETDYFD
jgi:hypothetical protein